MTIGSLIPFNFANNVLLYTYAGFLLVLEHLLSNNAFNETWILFRQKPTK